MFDTTVAHVVMSQFGDLAVLWTDDGRHGIRVMLNERTFPSTVTLNAADLPVSRFTLLNIKGVTYRVLERKIERDEATSAPVVFSVEKFQSRYGWDRVAFP